jgi:hypothetical protein
MLQAASAILRPRNDAIAKRDENGRERAHVPGREDQRMTKVSDQLLRDIFIVQPRPSTQESGSLNSWSSTHTVTFPGGQRVHVLDQEVFDRAVRAAAGENSKQDKP